MKPELIVIDKPEDVGALHVYLANKDYITFDTETTGLNKHDEIIGYSVCAEENKAYYVILCKWSKEEGKLHYLDTRIASIKLIDSLRYKNLIMHNGVFDCMMVESCLKVSLIDSLHTDTMILAHLLNENRRVGLKELSSEYFGDDSKKEQEEMKASVVANGGKLTKSQYDMFKADPYLMGKYGAKDALLTYKLFLRLVPELYQQGLNEFFYDDESMPLLKGPTYELNTTGLSIDQNKLLNLKKTLEAECLEAKSFISDEIEPYIKDKYPGTNAKNTFNINASQQLSWLLFEKLEIQFGNLTKGGKEVSRQLGLSRLPYTYNAKLEFIHACKTSPIKKYSNPWKYTACDKKFLSSIASKHKWVEKLLEYQKKKKILNTYVEGMEERVKYGILQPSFLQHGTTSGRYSSRNPNFQNLPRDDKRVKACIVSRPGKVFVGADYSQLEPRVFAYISGDARLLEAFKGSDDFYSVIGMEVYNKYDCTPKKEGNNAFGVKYKKLRDLSKVIALASTYGATAHQLASTTGKSIDATQEDIDAYFERFPDVANMMLESHNKAKKDGAVYNIFGRPRRIPEALKIIKLYGNVSHSDLPYNARSLLNLAVNHRIQSTGASIVNRASIRFCEYCKKANINAKLVMQVHDSLIVECLEKDANDVSILLQDAMENTTQLEGIALEALPKIGINLAEV